MSFAITLAIATGSGGSAEPQEDFTLYAAAQLVVLNVGVQDIHGANIKGLRAEHFKVFEDGQLQSIKQFSVEERPVTVGILVDASASMRTKQSEVARAALAFMGASHPDDEMFVIHFNDRAFSGLPSHLNFTNDPEQLKSALLARRAEGRTALYDALILGAAHLAKGKWENKALLLISDGGDNNSDHKLGEAIDTIQNSGATVYAVNIFEPHDPEHKPRVLRRLSRMSGGEIFTPRGIGELDSICVRIAQDIRSSYTIAYTPPRPDQYSKSRKLKVVVTTPGSTKTVVRTRTAYTLNR